LEFIPFSIQDLAFIPNYVCEPLDHMLLLLLVSDTGFDFAQQIRLSEPKSKLFN
jgi:hypothetical protein